MNSGPSPEPSPSQDRFEPHPDVVSQDAGDRALLVHLETGETFALNASGQTVWALLGDGEPVSAIRSHLASHTDASADQVQGDVDQLLADLIHHRLIRPART